MRNRLFIVKLAIFFIVSSVSATIIHVPDDSDNIQTAISGAFDGDTILVSPGLYNEHIRFFGKAVLLKSESGPESTIIEKVYENWSLIYFLDGESPSSIIEGFTLRNASSSAVKIVGSAPTVRNCIIENNTVFPPEFDYFGGGITLRDSDNYAVIRSNIIRYNDATHGFGFLGGGIFVNDAYAIIDSNIIHGNVSNFGGAIDGHGGSLIVTNNLIYENEAEIEGGSILIRGQSNASIINNTIAYNTSVGLAGGLIINECEGVDIRNNIMANNNLYAIYVIMSHDIQLNYNCIFPYTDSLFYGFVPGAGNIFENPLFWDIIIDDYTLHRNSPCIDTGDPASPPDYDGSPADMGAIAFDPEDHLLNFSLIAPPTDSAYAYPPQFVWNQSGDLDSGYTVYYRFYIDDDPGFNAPDSSIELADTTYLFQDSLIRSTQYFWKVKAYSYHEPAVYSDEVWNFYLDGNPSMPTVQAPEDGDFADSNTNLFWTACTDPDPMDSITYTVQIDDDASFNSPEIDVSGITNIGLILEGVATVRLGDMPGFENLEDNQTYFWRVRSDDLFGLHSEYTDGSNFFHFGGDLLNIYNYLPGDINMAGGYWPPAVIAGDVTYLVNYFRSLPSAPPCVMGDLWLSADVNGDCNVLGNDVTRLVTYFRGLADIHYCPYFEPTWHTPDELPDDPPSGWPNCD